MRAYFYGEIQLWQIGLYHLFPRSRQVAMTFSGVDQLFGVVLPQSPNFLGELTIHSFWGPGAEFTQGEFRNALDKKESELIARSEQLYPVFNTEGLQSFVSHVGPPILTNLPHGLSIGDRVYIWREGHHSIVTVKGVPSSMSFTINEATTGISINDIVYRIESSYENCSFQGMTKPAPMGGNGDYYAEDVEYAFLTSGETLWP